MRSAQQQRQKRATAGQRHRSRAAIVEKAIDAIGQKLESNNLKATIGDFIRLLELERQLELDEPKEIRVTWVQPTETESASET